MRIYVTSIYNTLLNIHAYDRWQDRRDFGLSFRLCSFYPQAPTAVAERSKTYSIGKEPVALGGIRQVT